jgi:hypothetical protein
MRAKLLVALLGAVASACASPQEARYSKPGTTQDEFMADRFDCIAESEQDVSNPLLAVVGGATTVNRLPNCEKWTSCMKARGYSPDPNGDLRAPPRMAIKCQR